MRIYLIILGIIVLSASLQIVNDLGVFSTPLPTQTFDSAQGKVIALTNTTSTTSVNDLSSDFMGTFGILRVVGYLISAFSAAIVIVPLLSAWQIPLSVSLPIQGLIYFIYGIGISQFLSGRGLKYYE